jgi:uncharacterized protein YjcR
MRGCVCDRARDYTAARAAARQLMALGHDTTSVAAALGVDVRTVQKWARRSRLAEAEVVAAARALAAARAGA